MNAIILQTYTTIDIEILAAIYKRRRHAELTPEAFTQGCNTLRLIYEHSHRGSVAVFLHDIAK